jgi:hypothetical protein
LRFISRRREIVHKKEKRENQSHKEGRKEYEPLSYLLIKDKQKIETQEGILQ